jgi:hypothetical protein
LGIEKETGTEVEKAFLNKNVTTVATLESWG